MQRSGRTNKREEIKEKDQSFAGRAENSQTFEQTQRISAKLHMFPGTNIQ